MKENLFRFDTNNTIFTNTANELIDIMQKGRVLSLARGELNSFNRVSVACETLLDRWKWMDLCFHVRKIQFITACNYSDSR